VNNRRLFITGVWVCAVMLVSGYATAYWTIGRDTIMQGAQWAGLQYEQIAPISVPMIRDGNLNGYTVIKLVYTADSETLRQQPVPPGLMVADEAYRTIYAADNIDLDHLDRYDLGEFSKAVRQNVNTRLKADIVQDILVEQISFFSREQTTP
jgi:hypothetical protein